MKHSIQVYYLVSNVDSICSFTSTCVKESSHMNCTVARPSPSSYTAWVRHPSSRWWSLQYNWSRDDLGTVRRGALWLSLMVPGCPSWQMLAMRSYTVWGWASCTAGSLERNSAISMSLWVSEGVCVCECVRMWGVACYALTVKQALFRLTNLMGKLTMVGFFSTKKLFFVKRWEWEEEGRNWYLTLMR